MTGKAGEREIYIPFAAAAQITHLSEKRIRNWLDNGHVRLDADDRRPDASKHRRFSRLDLVRLALVGRLTGLGFSAERASLLIEDQVHVHALITKQERKGRRKIVLPSSDKVRQQGFDPHAYYAEIIAGTDEDEILDALRDQVMTIYFYEGNLAETDQESEFSVFTHDQHKDPPEWGTKPDTSVRIEVWRILQTINERLEGMDLK